MFNRDHIRTLRTAQNNQARVNRFRNSSQLPFLKIGELADGTYPFRIWPSEPTKNPFGYLYYATHTILDDPKFPFQCPRSNNWDPVPVAWERFQADKLHPDGGQWVPSSQQEAEANALLPAADQQFFEPIFTVRCWGCEVEAQVKSLGVELKNLSSRLQEWLAGDRSTNTEGLFGEQDYAFPATFKARIFQTEKKVSANSGKEYDQHTYCYDADLNFHCVLKLNEGGVLRDLFRLIDEVPDCSHMTMGRWFRLIKSNGGSGVGGYKLEIAPNPAPAGFDLPTKLYPNFANWGKGSPQHGRPSKRKDYAHVEAIGSNPDKWWVPELASQGIILSDGAPF